MSHIETKQRVQPTYVQCEYVGDADQVVYADSHTLQPVETTLMYSLVSDQYYSRKTSAVTYSQTESL
jgi:hypothetical protein